MKLDRLLGIVTILLQKEKVTAPYLVSRFEVSRRTIQRDIDALCRAGIPIITRQGGNGGISIAEGFKLDKSVLTTGELSDIISALKGLGSVSGVSQIERTLDKLGNNNAVVSLKETIIIDLSSHYKNSLSEKISLFKQAAQECRYVEFTYYYEKGDVRRRIEPYFIAFHWANWYVFGYCGMRSDWRLFKLNRLWEPVLCDEVFEPRKIPPEKMNLDSGFTDLNHIVVMFDKSAKYQLIDCYGPNCYTEKDGKLFFEIDYTNRDYIISWILSFGSKAVVISPADLADEIRDIAKAIYDSYD